MRMPKTYTAHADWLVQERCNCIGLAMELHLSCTNPSIWKHMYICRILEKYCHFNFFNWNLVNLYSCLYRLLCAYSDAVMRNICDPCIYANVIFYCLTSNNTFALSDEVCLCVMGNFHDRRYQSKITRGTMSYFHKVICMLIFNLLSAGSKCIPVFCRNFSWYLSEWPFGEYLDK